MIELFNLRVTLVDNTVKMVVNKDEMDKLVKLADSSSDMIVERLSSWKVNI